jgi:hypothetical protein
MTLYACMGSATSCSSTTLAAYIASPSTSSQWKTLASFPLKSLNTTAYKDPEPYSALLNYAATDTPTGGAAGPVSAITVFQMPAQTAQAPSLSVVGNAIVTSGSTGVQ